MSLFSNHSQFLQRAAAMRENLAVLTKSEFEERRAYFLEKLQSTEFFALVEELGAPVNPLTDAATNDALMDMAKNNIMSYVPQTLIMGWVNYFFAGLVVMKLPFALTLGFKSMLQDGVNTPDLSVRYVLAISWYFVNLFGLRAVYALLMEDNEAALQLMQQQQQQTPLLGGPGAPKADKVFLAELENFQILEHELVFAGIAERVLKLTPT